MALGVASVEHISHWHGVLDYVEVKVSQLEIKPFSGINKRFPEHKLVGKKDQYLIEAWNYETVNGRLATIPGAERYDSATHPGPTTWAKRLYYRIGNDLHRDQFVVMGRKMYKGNDETRTLSQVTINADRDFLLEDFYPRSCSITQSGNTVEMMVDGKYFYKFVPNEAGNWERLPIKNDIDGNEIEPIDIAFWLDRVWVLVKNRNVLLVSQNLNTEKFDDATDSVLIALPPGEGGYPCALVKHRGFLYVFHEDYFTPISGTSASTFAVLPGDVVYGYGTRARRSVISSGTEIGFLNSFNNEYHLTGGTIDSTPKTPLSYHIQLSKLVNPINTENTVAHIDTAKNLWRIAYIPNGEASVNHEVLYSIDEEKWCGETRDRKVSCYCQWNGEGDQKELLTGRSDIGALMINDRGFDFDGNAQRYRFVTASYVGKDDTKDMIFSQFFVDAKAFGRTKMQLSYYLESRLTTRGTSDVNQQGEVINLGLIEIGEQKSFLDRVLPLISRSRGRMIRFESDETISNVSREIYAIFAEYEQEENKMSKTIVGV